MKEFIIECPSGYEIDKEKSTFEKIVFKEIGVKFPESAELTHTSGLAYDMTIIFSGLVTIGKEKVIKHVNEKSIVEIFSPKKMDSKIDTDSEGGCGIVIHV
jgi:hypothetical protein